MIDKLCLILVLILIKIESVSFQSLYNRQIKSTYGFQILKHYHSEKFGNQTVKKFNGQSVLFMTPWREKGIELALTYLKKFNYFVPCYYDLKKKRTPEANESIQLETSKYYSEEYLKRAKQANPQIKILPRLHVHGMQGDVFFLVSTEEQQMNLLIQYTKEIVSNPYYDGIVFQSPFITPSHKYPFSMKNIMKTIKNVIEEHSKLLFIVMDGVDNKPQNSINKKKARQLIDLADRLIITNYDYPKGNQGNVIPISPMHWIKENYAFYCEIYSTKKLLPKLIMAIPLYGYFVALYGKYDPINGEQFLQKIKTQKNAWLYWNQDIDECMIYLNKMQFLYFPCLHFFNTRLRYFQSLNIGVAAFEIGSGLQIFMQMF